MSTPPGWYPDAQGTTRWFDGTRWTEHTQDAAPTAPPTAGPAGPTGPTAPAAPVAPTEPPATAPYGTGAQPGWTPMPPAPPGFQPGAPMGAGYPTPPARKSNTGLLVGLGVLGLVLIAGIIAAGVLLATRSSDSSATATGSTTISAPPVNSAGGGDTTAPAAPSTPAAPPSPVAPVSGDSPEAVTQGFFDAIFSGDCSKVKDYVSGGAALGAGSGCGSASIPTGLGDQLKVQVGKATINGDTATVKVKLVPNIAGVDGSQYASSLTTTLSNADGSWKITNVG